MTNRVLVCQYCGTPAPYGLCDDCSVKQQRREEAIAEAADNESDWEEE